MNTYSGKAAVQGIAIGTILELRKKSNIVRREHITDVEAEMKRLTIAQAETIQQLQMLYDKAIKEVGEANAAIFEIHQMMLEDDDYVDSIHNIIRTQSVNAEYAVATTGDNFSAMFAAMENDEYMNARAADVKDISERLINVLNNSKDSDFKLSEKAIIVADDLVPSETLQLDKDKVLAFVTRQGSVNSHTAILARTMNIPALVSVPVPEDINGKIAIVNGFKSSMIIEPTEQMLKDAEKLKQEQAEKIKLLQEYKGKNTVTKSGKRINLYANIGGVSHVADALQNDSEGIGLFRSEFLYLQEEEYPSEDKQFQAYKMVAEMMAGKKVIIRTLDVGADKQIDYFQLEKEENPAMGFRAVRICLKREDVFKTQIRALLRASAFGSIAIMVPMIISVWEVKKVKEIIETVKEQLKNEGISFDAHAEFGIMIETPAAVMIADELAKEVDFFSIGTNDLTQYTLAIDRQNPKLDMFYDPHHPAILRLIRMTIESAHRAGIWAGICGELAADTKLTSKFVEMGVDELSVSPPMILSVRKRICEME